MEKSRPSRSTAPVYPNWLNDNLADRLVAQALAEAGRIHQDVFTTGAAQ
jgi:hypothetical protein